MTKRIFFWIIGSIILLGIGVIVAFKISPWPSVWYVRNAFKKEGAAENERLAKHVPKDVIKKTDIWYDSAYDDTKLDLYYPPSASNDNKKYTLVIWVHGGGFIGGDKTELANYCQILASKGYIIAVPNYSLAPNEKYPVPVRQINQCVQFLIQHAAEYGIEAADIIIAGDSAGAHISAQLANAYTSESYAALLGIQQGMAANKLKGVILHCGPYQTSLVDFDGEFGRFLQVALWSYMGRKDFRKSPGYASFSVTEFVTANFPPTFISVGNQDPLRQHSYALAAQLSSKSVPVDSLFFPDNYSPALHHEYQFNLDSEAGKLALERTVKFIEACIHTKANQ